MSKLKNILKKHAGRRNGTVTVRHQGGGSKKFLREVDFKRNKIGVWGKVEAIEYDPNRNARLALVLYEDGERRYILAPNGLSVGNRVVSSKNAPIEVGNCLSVGNIPVGTQVHNIEITIGKGGQIVKSAGSAAVIFGREEVASNKEGGWILIKLPSGETRRFNPNAMATVGQVGNINDKDRVLGKAGASRRRGIRPSVRGVAMHPNAHPHGGGEGRSGVGLKYPKTFYGRKAVGKTRNKKKYSNRLILSKK